MILSIRHEGLRGYLLKGVGLPPALLDKHEQLRYWLTILNAATCPEDFIFPEGTLIKQRPGYRLEVIGLGVFSFEFVNSCIDNLNFKKG